MTIYTKKQQKHLPRRKSYNLVNVWSWVSIHWLPEQSCPVFNKLTRRELAVQSKNQLLVSGQLLKTLDLDELSTWAWSPDTGQQIPCFDRCQLIITWMSNTKEVHSKPRLHVSLSTCYLKYGRHVARLRRRRAYAPTRKSTHGFPFVSHIWVTYGAPLSTLRFSSIVSWLKIYHHCLCYMFNHVDSSWSFGVLEYQHVSRVQYFEYFCPGTPCSIKKFFL